MFTRCPQCKTVHPLTAALVSRARGLVRCGNCNRTFSALSFLFDEWPSGQAHRPVEGASAAAPVIGFVAKTDEANKSISAEDDEPDETTDSPDRLAWLVATTLLVLLTMANTAWTFREPLMENPRINDWTQPGLFANHLWKTPGSMTGSNKQAGCRYTRKVCLKNHNSFSL